MITYINSENATKYSRLFSEAEDALVRKWIGEGLNPESADRFGPIIDTLCNFFPATFKAKPTV